MNPFTDEEKEALKRVLMKVIPGDIWMKDSSSENDVDANGNIDFQWNDHIAIVAYVPPNAAELTVDELMNQIILIEGEFTNKIQSVIKKLSVGDYNRGNIPVGREIYPNFTVPDQIQQTPAVLDPIDLNCASWAVRRLK